MYKKYAQIRDARGVTDYYVAKHAKIAQATLTRWKAGSLPRADKLVRIADVLGVTLDELAGR